MSLLHRAHRYEINATETEQNGLKTNKLWLISLDSKTVNTSSSREHGHGLEAAGREFGWGSDCRERLRPRTGMAVRWALVHADPR
jgi:hypothetical protein